MCIYRSLVPTLVVDEYNRGPFILDYGWLNKSALLFDENFALTGVINWELSITEPLQVAAILSPFITQLPINFDPTA